MKAQFNISSAKEASQAIAGLARTNRDEVGPAIIQILSGLTGRALAPRALLDIAEVLRPAGEDAVAVCRSGYTDRALPLDEEAARQFGRAMTLLAAFETLYQRAFETALATPPRDPARKDLGAALQRSMACAVEQMIEHYRARQTVGFALWKRLQRSMQIAIREKLDEVGVPDPLHPRATATPLAIYGCALLLSIAQAGAMAHRNLEATLTLAAVFGHLVELAMIEQGEGGAVHATPAGGMAGVSTERTGRIRMVAVGGVTHILNATKMDEALKQSIQHLAEGGSPDRIGLATVARADLADLLPRMRQIWCGRGEIREAERQPLQERSAVAIGFQDIYRFASPQPLAIPKEFAVYDARRAAVPEKTTQVLAFEQQGSSLEIWEALDHSPSGLRAQRAGPGTRLRRGQLLAVYFNGMQTGSGFALGEVRWLQQFTESDAGGIAAGIRFVSLDAQVALVRVFRLVPEHYQTIGPAFVLSQSNPQKMVLPSGWFVPGRKVDLWLKERLSTVRLTDLQARGADYEIVDYDLIR